MTKIAKRILSSAKKIIEDHKNSNLFLEILENLQNDEEDIAIACCDACGKVFNHFILTTDFLDLDKHDDSSKDQKQQYHVWLREQYETTLELICKHMDSDNITIQLSAFEALTLILSALEKKNAESCSSRRRDIAKKLMTSILDDEKDKVKLISQLPTLLAECGEKRGETVMTFLVCVRESIKENEKKKVTSDAWAFNVWRVVTVVTGQELDNKMKNTLNKVVFNFLKQNVPNKLYKDVLTGISAVIEQMSNPVLLTDFLSQAFDVGGAISLMSLNGLFLLMHKHNLNYPDFYDKLYSLFQPQIFGAKYRSRFFHLADTFLSSTHLPGYLVAAFVKRLARLALHAPASGVRICVAFIFNLIKKHPACDVLLHRVEGPTEFDTDPYLENEPPATCKALDSCIWELKTLEHHFDPFINGKVKKRRIREVDLGSFLDKTTTEVIERDAKRRAEVVPLTFDKNTDFNLFGKFVI